MKTTPRTPKPGRQSPVALALTMAAAAAGWVIGGRLAALGGACGALAAVGYCRSYLRSHAAGSARAARPAPAGEAAARLVITVGFGVGMFLVGRPAVLAYLMAFGAVFVALVVPEIARVTRQIRARK